MANYLNFTGFFKEKRAYTKLEAATQLYMELTSDPLDPNVSAHLRLESLFRKHDHRIEEKKGEIYTTYAHIASVCGWTNKQAQHLIQTLEKWELIEALHVYYHRPNGEVSKRIAGTTIKLNKEFGYVFHTCF